MAAPLAGSKNRMHLLTFWAFSPLPVRLLKGVAISQQLWGRSSPGCAIAPVHIGVLLRSPQPIGRTDSQAAPRISCSGDPWRRRQQNVEGADAKPLKGCAA